MRRMTVTVAVAAAALAAFSNAAVADDVDELVRKLDPPKRFEGYGPDFSVHKQTFTFQAMDGEWNWPFWVVMDGEKYVAVIPTVGFHGGTIYVQSFNPLKAPTELDLPTERWHIDTAVGTEMRTDAWIPDSEGKKDSTWEWAVGAETLTLTRRFKGTTKFSKWEHRSRKPETVDHTGTFVFRVDPVLGYVVEGTWDTRAKPAPKRFQYASAATSGRYSLWPGSETVFRTVTCPVGKDGFEGFYMNLPSIDRCDGGGRLTCRDGGFAGYLNDKTGWSPVMTQSGGDARLVVCNAHADLDFSTRWSQGAEDVGDGFSHRVFRHRMLALPPELTRHVWEEMDVWFQDDRKVQIRVGTTETFEDQPRPLTTRARGLTFTGPGPKVSTDHARSGERSMQVNGRVWPNLPQLALEPDTKYRLEAFFKVQPLSEEERAARIEKARARVEKRKKRGKDAEFTALPEPKAYIQADFYQWSPHSGKMVEKMRTTEAVPGHDGWQKVTLEFESPSWGPFLNLTFQADACHAWVDDFTLESVE